MARRTKREMELMKDDCIYYLLQTKNNPHKAYDLFVKDHLEAAKTIPYYMKGIKDFITVSQDLAVELNQKEQMKKADQERITRKETIINYIKSLTKEETYKLYKEYKDKLIQSDKLVLVDIYNMKAVNEFNEKYIDQHTINVFQTIYRESLQPA